MTEKTEGSGTGILWQRGSITGSIGLTLFIDDKDNGNISSSDFISWRVLDSDSLQINSLAVFSWLDFSNDV